MDLRQLRYFVAVAERGGFALQQAPSTSRSRRSPVTSSSSSMNSAARCWSAARAACRSRKSGKVLLARGRWLLGTVDDIKAEVRTENREPQVRCGWGRRRAWPTYSTRR